MGELGPETCPLSPGTWDSLKNCIEFCKDIAPLKDGAPYHTGFAADGSSVVVLQRSQSTSLEPKSLNYAVYEWSLEKRGTPVLLSEGTLDLALGMKDESMIAELAKSQDPKVISFSSDLSCIRIGPRVFVKEKTSNYVDLSNLELMTEGSSPCFEYVGHQKSNLVLASRTKLSAMIPTRDRKQKTVAGKEENEKPDADTASKEETKNVSLDDSKDKVRSNISSPSRDLKNAPSDGEADDESATSSPEPESSAWNSAEESWSEASTEADEDVDVAIATLESSEDESSEANETDTDSDNGSKSSSKDDASDGPVATQGGLLQDSDYDSGEPDLDWLDDTDSYDGASESGMDVRYCSDLGSDGWTSDIETFIRSYGRSRVKPRYKGQQGMLMLYDLNSGHPVQLFKFSHQLTTVLENSPPAIHPTKPLVVWPLSGGDILFADYRANSYFIRKLRPSARKASHKFVKCHFSPCGKYLHIASLESQLEPVTKKELKKGTTPSTLLSVFVSTHCLSKRKTTRGPPLLIHRVKFSLGKQSSTEMPIQVTWSPDHAFISSSSASDKLSLFRVELFAPPKGEKKDLVCVPKDSVLLPKSARLTEVHYFAPRPQDTRALITIASSTNDKDEAKSDNKAGKDEKAEDNEKPKDEKTGSDGANNNKSKSDPANNVEQKSETPQDEKAEAKKLKDDASKDTAKSKVEPIKTFSPPMIFYLNVDTDLGGWVPSDGIEEIKSDTAKGSLEQKRDKFIEDDCCC